MTKYKYEPEYITSVASNYVLLSDFYRDHKNLYNYTMYKKWSCLSNLKRNPGRTKGAIGKKFIGVEREMRRKNNYSDYVTTDGTKLSAVKGLLGLYTRVNIDGKWMCGRCMKNRSRDLNQKLRIQMDNLCQPCSTLYYKNLLLGLDSNLGNLKDSFCNIVINDGGKSFKLGCNVDEKLKDFLIKMGYGFIFIGEEDILNI